MVAGERLSYLKVEEQELVLEAVANISIYPSPAQAEQLKDMSEKETLSEKRLCTSGKEREQRTERDDFIKENPELFSTGIHKSADRGSNLFAFGSVETGKEGV